MLYIILSIVLGVIALAAFGMSLLKVRDNSASYHSSSGEPQFYNMKPWRWVALAVVLLWGLISFLMSITIVDSRAVGIQTAFGRYQGNLGNGLQLTAPWSSVEEFTTRIQSLDLDGDKQGVRVTFKGGGGGVVNVTPRWSIDEKKAGDLWKKYKTFGTVEDRLVRSAAKDSVRVVTANYTPNEARSGEFLRKLTGEVKADLAGQLNDDGIKIDSISVSGIELDERARSSLDKIVEANNYIERAKAEQERAKIEAETAKIRQATGALSDANITMKCLEILDKWNSASNGPLPAGFVCPGTERPPFTTTNR